MTLLERLARSFAREHPEELALFIADADAAVARDFLTRLSDAEAAAVIARSAPLDAGAALRTMPERRAGGILSELDAWSVAAILRALEEPARARLVATLGAPDAQSVRGLLAFSPDQAGSRMDPRSPSVPIDATVRQAIDAARREPRGALYYVYVVGENYVLAGVLNMRELLSAEPSSPVRAVMTENPERIQAETPLEGVLRHPAWRKVHALPVVDQRGTFLGAIRYSTFRKLEAEAGRGLPGSDSTRTSGALAELFLLGAAAVARTAGSALLGSSGRHPRGS